MADQGLDLIVLSQGGSGLAPRPPVDEDLADDCIPCEERRRLRAALVEFRRGVGAFSRGVDTLLAALDMDDCDRET